MKTGRPSSNPAQSKYNRERPPINPPKLLTLNERKTWRAIQQQNPHLRRRHWEPVLVELCKAVERCRKMEAVLESEGYFVPTKDGVPKSHPANTILKNNGDLVAKFVSGLGLTPASRRTVVEKGQDASELDPPKTPEVLKRKLHLA
jgi:P27 family predicted phage terminase small subunit